MSKTSLRKFWKYIKNFKRSPSDRNNLDSDSFVNNFSNISNLRHSNFIADDFIQSRDAPFCIEQLDCTKCRKPYLQRIKIRVLII
jgi:hypothetical protein